MKNKITKPDTIMAAAALSAAALASPVYADATLIMVNASGAEDAQIQVKGDMVRMSQPGQPDYVLYDKSRNTLIHVRAAQKEYMEIDSQTMQEYGESMAQMREQMAPQMEMMREQLKNLPPEQRAMIEQRMGGMVDFSKFETAPVPKTSIRKTGSDTVSGFDCERYDVMADAQKVAEVCVASEADAGLSSAEFDTLEAMMSFMRDMATQAQKLTSGMGMGVPALDLGDVDGVPVEMRDLQNGGTVRVSKVSDTDLDDALFQDYKQFSKKELPPMK